MDDKKKRDLEKRMLEKAKEYLELVREYIPEESHAAMTVWPDHISVGIYNMPEARSVIHAWADPRMTPMEVNR